MRGFIEKRLPWVPPLDAGSYFSRFAHMPFVLLYSGKREGGGRYYSYLATYPSRIFAGGDFDALAACLGNDRAALENSWFGYIGYEMLCRLEAAPVAHEGYISLPDMWFASFGLIMRFDHTEETVTAFHGVGVPVPQWPIMPCPVEGVPEVQSLISSMTRDEYLAIVNATKEAIARGAFYQANITRKFTGQFRSAPDSFSLFRRLCDASPSAYSAYVHTGNAAILSSSPECFLKADAGGMMESRPIKGTAPRFADREKDEAVKQGLVESEKERAENLMIVDLMRNDLSRSCVTGSIKVRNLFEVESYATLHHIVSSVHGRKREGVSTLEAVKRCFPPGSMTGAPKISAVNWCAAHERIGRGVYSGALGWFGGDGSCDLSVVIRTLVVQGKRFEFQVGGGITSGSDPQAELQETVTKARGIMAALGLDAERLYGL